MRVLLIVHGFPPSATGGTEIYTYDLARALHRSFGDDVHVLTRDADPGRPEYAVRRERRDGLSIVAVNNTFARCRSFEESYSNPAIRDLGGALLGEIDPAVVHIQHLTCLSTELVVECSRRGIPTLFTLNDYWLLCHRGQLLDRDYRRCSGPEGCTRCLDVSAGARASIFRGAAMIRALDARLPRPAARWLQRLARRGAELTADPSTAAGAMQRRLDHMRWISGMVTCFLAPSHTLRERFLRFGVGEDRLLYQPQGIDPEPFRKIVREPSGRLRLGFLGSLMVSKAPHLLLEAFAGLPRAAASLSLYGECVAYHGDDSYRQTLEPLLAQPGVRHIGTVPHGRVADALGGIDVLVVPSIWIENAPFVIREAFAAGVPVVAARLGGMAEMVAHGKSGLLFEPGDSADLRRTLQRFLDEPGLLHRLRAGIPTVTSIEEDAALTRELYRRLAPDDRGAPYEVAPGPLPRLVAVVLNYRTPEQTRLTLNSLRASRRHIDELLVVDNGPAGGAGCPLPVLFPDTTVLETTENLGFSGGCNVGIRRALENGAALVLLVNSDVWVPPDCIDRLERILASDSTIGVVGPLLLSRSNPEHVLSAGISFSEFSGRMRHEGYGRRFGSPGPRNSRAVAGVSGCVMLVRREVFEQIGLLDQDYFFSFEDLDFCLRARQAGYRATVVGGALAYHEGSASIGPRSASRVYFAARNHLLLASRATAPANRAHRLYRAGCIVAFNVAHALVSSPTSMWRGLPALARGIRDHARGRYGQEGGEKD